MRTNRIFVLFYDAKELNIKDVESELFTEEKVAFNFYFFHNKNMHFDKNIIYHNKLKELFDNVEPEFHIEGDTIRLVKQINDYNANSFRVLAEKEYESYLSKINYRIDCIFQSFFLFSQLYATKDMIFIFPLQIKTRFIEILKKEEKSFKKFDDLSYLVKKYDFVYRIQYYFGMDNTYSDKFTEEKIDSVFEII